MATNGIMTLIESYLVTIRRLSAQLEREYEIDSLFMARKSEGIPRIGKFGNAGEFQFHGIGCTIDDESGSVNFDFFENGRSDGFDAWRLHTFAMDNEITWDPDLDTSLESIKAEIAKMVSSGRIVPVEGSSLYKLASSE
jgi:hypothetical protein